ncbi:MAG: hypothetical protein ACK5V2_09100 [Pseudomonadota bacterium]
MGFSTFSGPIRSGTQRLGTVAEGRNTGLVVLSQSVDTGVVTAGVGNVDLRFGNLPAGAQIINITVDQIVVPGGSSTATISVGNAAGGAQFFPATATTGGGRFPTTAIANMLNWATLPTNADTQLWVRYAVGVAAGVGRAVINVQYVQRASNGAAAPTTFEV